MSPSTIRRQALRLLIVDDDDDDRELILRSLVRTDPKWDVSMARDGLEALEMMRDESDSRLAGQSYIVLLDWKMPRMNGLEFLREIRGDSSLRDTPVFVLTTSDNDEDKRAAYDLFVSGYIVKGRAGHDYAQLVELLGTYGRLVELPS